MQRLLAVISELDSAARVVERARLLANRMHAELLLLRPVQDQLGAWQTHFPEGNFGQLREEILTAERAQLDAVRGGDPGTVVWCDRTYQAVVEQAEQLGADLIVIQASRHGLLESLFRRADDWHLLREAPCPVLLLPRTPRPVTAVIAAIDALAEGPDQELLAERVLDQARSFAQVHGLPLTVVTVVPDPALIYASPVAIPLSTDLIGELTDHALTALQAILERSGLRADQTRVETGRVEDVLAELATDGLLVIGSAANKGLKGLVLGNTAERILHHVTTEMLVVN